MEKKDFLEGIKKKNIENVVFKPEGLGAIEFDLRMTTRNFTTTEVPFRVERISTDTFLRIADIKNGMKSVEEILKTFIAFPSEARDKEYFNLDLNAMTNLVEFIMEFQQTPFLFIENFKGD